MIVEVNIQNVPEYAKEDGYIVARLVDAELWFYGCYDTEERAIEVARQLENGVVCKVVAE